jgi:aminoglycoside phosphotransferase (APT) family kinase protein
MTFDDPTTRYRLAEFVTRAAGARKADIVLLERMSGGAVQENWALDVELDGRLQHWVLRTDAQATVPESLSRAQEFAILKVAHPAQVFAPAPLYLCEDLSVTGRPFFIMERLPGVAAAHLITRDSALVPDAARLASDLAVNLARVHRIPLTHPDLRFLTRALARDNIAAYRAYLDTLDRAYPVLEWGLRWCELNVPEHEETTFIHRDYRTGNYLVHDGGLAGVLDWEFSACGNPLEDVAWICVRYWRFARPDLEVGGIARLEDFIPAYEEAAGRRVSRRALDYWQVMGNLRWAVIVLQQVQRHLSGVERSLELALTGHIVGQVELEILDLAGGA